MNRSIGIDGVTLDQLRVFIAVADRGHLTRAAEDLHLTPSAVSASIGALEGRYGVRLFDRIGRRIALTQVGRTFLVEAKATQRSARLSELALIELGGMRRGTLTIQASQTIASYWLPPFLVAYKAVYPEIELVLRESNSADVAKALLDGTADLGFAEGDINDAALEITHMAHDHLVIVAAPGHPMAGQPTVSPREIVQASWILREKGSGTRSVFEAALRLRGIVPAALHTILELPTNEAVCAAVRSGTHLSVMSELVARPHVDAGRLTPIAFEIETRAFHLVRHRQRFRTKAALALEALLPHPAGGPRGSDGAGA